MVKTSRMPLYVMLMSSYVTLTLLYGCGGCDGEKLKKCVDDFSGTTATAAPGRIHFSPLEDDLSAICKDFQAMVDCIGEVGCDCTCKELQESGGDACTNDDETVSARLDIMIDDFEKKYGKDNIQNECFAKCNADECVGETLLQGNPCVEGAPNPGR